MSRIGNKPVAVPNKVQVTVNKNEVTVKGPKGELKETFNPDMTIKVEDGQIIIERPNDLKHFKALHGLTRALLANMVTGVSEGFRKTLLITGVGYQAQMQGNNLQLRLGHSHEVIVEPPENVSFDVPKDSRGQMIHVDGIDKQVVGQTAANIRGWRPPEPYKGKGVRYSDENIIRKAGKAGKK
ncbi:50S ribosomal protein L6 [Phototrophicus methaneseepsis]|uniref:Large ribosomal subunit protein uL6 n=1 Tax=Phototrophicus methaneseepsis TaxID=2710758 RepID=A0A7S8ED74_9CHLR|nr:50S ribosomal protein L6 [Phototrophicus methaneseepsis]QPC84813.1 50S ribosomal protein L6 [Phototrophicus methaneseepsis]